MNCTRIWCVRASAQESDQLFLKSGLVALAATEVDDDAAKLPPVRQAFKEAFARGAPEAPAASIPIAAGQLYRFVHEMRIGDSVIYPRKSERTLRWGEITGPDVFARCTHSRTGVASDGCASCRATRFRPARDMNWAPS
ncbi:MAG: hypothetical protein U1E28_20080 [Beijerinckiaceae bacterium]